MKIRVVLCLHVLMTTLALGDYCLREFRELVRGGKSYSEVAHTDSTLSPLISAKGFLTYDGEFRESVEAFDRRIAASQNHAQAQAAVREKISFLEEEVQKKQGMSYSRGWLAKVQQEIDRLKKAGKEISAPSLWRRFFGPASLASQVAERGAAASRLGEINRELHRLDPFHPQFQKLLEEQRKLVEKNFGGLLGAEEFVEAYRKAFTDTETSETDPLHPMGRRGDSSPTNSVRMEYLAGRELVVRSGGVEEAVRKARSVLGAKDPSQYLDSPGPGAKIRLGHPEVFIAAETLFLSSQLFNGPKLTAAELELVAAYSNTISELRNRSHTIEGRGPAETLEMGTLASLLSETRLQKNADRAYVIPPGSSFVDDSMTPRALALDRFRYLAAGQSGDAKSGSDEWLQWNGDLRDARYHRTRSDTWWGYQENISGRYVGWAQERREHSLYKSTDRRTLSFENMISGDFTNQFINGDGYKGVDRKNLLVRGANPAEVGQPRFSRPYDPAQRYANVNRDNIPAHVPGWFQVAEIPLGESANPQLKGFIRRVFWNEGKDPRVLGGAFVGKGEVRIAQQSIPLSVVLEREEADHPLKKGLSADFIQKNQGAKMSPSLHARLQKLVGELGEIDPVRWEVITGIEAIVEDHGLAQPMQWKWDAAGSRWVPMDSVKGKQGAAESDQPIFRFCSGCHARAGLLDAGSFSGACKKDPSTQKFFSEAARRVLLNR